MSREKRETPEAADLNPKTSRRDLLKRALIVLGAAAIVQPSGGVIGFAQEDPIAKVNTSKVKAAAAPPTGKRKGKGKGKKGKGGKKGPKKDGGK